MSYFSFMPDSISQKSFSYVKNDTLRYPFIRDQYKTFGERYAEKEFRVSNLFFRFLVYIHMYSNVNVQNRSSADPQIPSIQKTRDSNQWFKF